MLLQHDIYSICTEILIISTAVSGTIATITVFIIGVVVTRRMAKKYKWNDSYKSATIVNVLWFIVGMIVNLLVSFTVPTLTFLGSIFILIINIILGQQIVCLIYNKKFRESFMFVVIVQFILFVISIIVLLISLVILLVVMLGHLPDMSDFFQIPEIPEIPDIPEDPEIPEI